MRALIPLALFVLESCSTLPSAGLSRTVFGRIVSTREVEIWLGHVTGGGLVYEVALEQSPHRLIGLMAEARCPYDGRPRAQLFRIEYAVSGDRTVWGADYRGGGLPPHLMTSLFVLHCEPVGARR